MDLGNPNNGGNPGEGGSGTGDPYTSIHQDLADLESLVALLSDPNLKNATTTAVRRKAKLMMDVIKSEDFANTDDKAAIVVVQKLAELRERAEDAGVSIKEFDEAAKKMLASVGAQE